MKRLILTLTATTCLTCRLPVIQAVLPETLTERVLHIIRENYVDFGPTLAREKLGETHGLILAKETLQPTFCKSAAT